MTYSFGRFPKTTVLDGPPRGKWSGHNDPINGITVYRGRNALGVWAQEYYEWKRSITWTIVAAIGVAAIFTAAFMNFLPLGYVGAVAVGLGVWQTIRNSAEREIYSHAITYNVGRAYKLVDESYIDEMVGSLSTYSYCKKYSPEELKERLMSYRSKAQHWLYDRIDLLDKVKAAVG